MIPSGGLHSPSASNLHLPEEHPPHRPQHFPSTLHGSATPLPPEMLVMVLHPFLRPKLGAFSKPGQMALGQFLAALSIPMSILQYGEVALALFLPPHSSLSLAPSLPPHFPCVSPPAQHLEPELPAEQLPATTEEVKHSLYVCDYHHYYSNNV